ncbi:hypothetical protein Acr_00g0011930 [Actinidia rufa]|uniref:Uncharacterized protein n=1 Tax=Actinidia rufa TaxID=165716 RepID=A0A7J0DBE9_9ERIC|nr:hypothetical protein Acr_00g0011930 [Actinidia rufa]
MAPKSMKSKKHSLALVVLTPDMSKGQKRKATGNSRKGKRRKTKKGESSSAPALERNMLYFGKDNSQERYNLDFSLRKVLNGRWIDYSFFDSHNFEFNIVTPRSPVYADRGHVMAGGWPPRPTYLSSD